ncbi:MAG: DUF5752 family protein [Desulfobacterales bacterium]|nr:DUF5752 family protein [Desulfobacterales bacterium]MDD4073382.1 DUF5752 family protein [Desulfobacterales bacterium]MDD4391951.1 DUF5752 family protein [Desulfobacterales bacterium]
MANPFGVLDCALLAIATGEKAHTLRELQDRLTANDDFGIMYYHFWDTLLRPRFVDREYQNDFAAWAWNDLHDHRLAERLAILNPTDFSRMDDLRRKVIDVIEDRMDEEDFNPWIHVDHPFFLLRSQIIVFDTCIRISNPEKLPETVSKMSSSSIFYHFIDSRRRTVSGENDFSEWLRGIDGQFTTLADDIAAIDPYFNSLTELRNQLVTILYAYFNKREA